MQNKISFFQSGYAHNLKFAILLSLFLNICVTTNFISQNVVWNGNFQLPTLPGPQSYFNNTVNNWTGNNFELQNLKYNNVNGILFNQYIDLQTVPYHNGYIQQTVQVKNKGICNLSYYYTCQTNAFNSYIMEVYWNGNKVWTQQPTSLAIMMNQLTLQANEGINVLKLVEVGDDSDWSGLFIDQVALNCSISNNEESARDQNQLQFNSLIEIVLLGLFVPVPQCTPLRPLYLFANDIWIYNYDIIDYQNKTCLKNILSTLTLINSLSTTFLNEYTRLQRIKNSIGIGNKYINFTNEKFIKVEETSSILIDSCFFYFFYTCPEIITLSLLLYFFFCCIRKFRISRFFRKFYFVKTIIVLSVFQCNITYFVYVCFSHIDNSFTFTLLDKVYLIFTVFFLFLITIFAISFYFLITTYLKKSSRHFLHSLKRSHQSLNFLTIKNLIRGYIFGCIHIFLFGKYQIMLTLLCCVQCGIIMIMIVYQRRNKIFFSKIKFVIQILYNFSFVLLNLILYVIFMVRTNKREENMQVQTPQQVRNAIKQLMYQLEQIILNLQVFLLLTHILVDFFPKRLFKPSKQFKMNEKEMLQLKLNNRENKVNQSQTLEQKNKKKINIDLKKANTLNNQKEKQKKNAKLSIEKKERQQMSGLQNIMKTKVERVKKQKKQNLQIKFINYASNPKNNETKKVQKKYHQPNKQKIEIEIKGRNNKKDEFK